MSKNLLTKLLIGLSFLVAAVLWLLSVLIPEQFGFFNLNWAVVIVCGVSGLALVLRGLFSNKTGILKKADIFIGAILLILAGVSVAFALALPEKIVWPIIAIVLAAAALLSVLAVGGKKWDEGDNHRVGYKTYRERKAEEEKRSEEED